MLQEHGELVPDVGCRTRVDHGDGSAVLCTLATGSHRELLEMTAPTLDAYARRHGWSLILSSKCLAPDRPASWSKVVLIRELLAEFEFVFWVDADAIIVDIARDVLDEIESDADLWFARHPQQLDPDATVLNAGVLLARSSPTTRGLLREVWAATHLIDHNWWENAALLEVLGVSLDPPYPKLRASPYDERIGELPLDWNSVPGYCESERPAINHHARSDHDDFARRVADMRADLDLTRRRFPDAFPARDARLRRRRAQRQLDEPRPQDSVDPVTMGGPLPR